MKDRNEQNGRQDQRRSNRQGGWQVQRQDGRQNDKRESVRNNRTEYMFFDDGSKSFMCRVGGVDVKMVIGSSS